MLRLEQIEEGSERFYCKYSHESPKEKISITVTRNGVITWCHKKYIPIIKILRISNLDFRLVNKHQKSSSLSRSFKR